MVKLYTLSNCDSCRRAAKWLRARQVAFAERPIRETPPTVAELRAALAAQGDVRRLFNTAGQEYRALKIAEQLPAMSEAAAVALLAGNGRLVKRPFLVAGGAAWAGFDEQAWTRMIGRESV
jgi:arsenate reductase